MRLTVFGWSMDLVGWIGLRCEWVRVEVCNGHCMDDCDGISIEEATMD